MDARSDAGIDGMVSQQGRRIALRVPSGKVTAPLSNFPVYVDVSSGDLKSRLSATAAQLSFIHFDGSALAYEVQSWDAAAGRLRAWVKLPALDPSSETRFELRYGNDSVKAAPDPAGVWANGSKAVFHLEQAPVNDLPMVINSAAFSNPGTPTAMEGNDLVNAQLGRGYDFDAATEQVAFTNPITGGGPSTISFWFNDGDPTIGFDETILVLGTAATSQARWIYNEIDLNKFPVGLQGDDWAKPTVPALTGLTLVHWVYKDQQSRLYLNGVETPGGPFAHASPAATAGESAVLGNTPPSFGASHGLRGVVDELHIADVDRSAAWIAAEFSNQKEPATFVIASAPEDL
jgi:trimeric autotransporter adhesin